MMKALTIHQPYAHGIVLGLKRCETRSWRTNYRGEIAVHASVKVWTLKELQAMAEVSPADMFPTELGSQDEWTTGAVVATATLVDCVLMTPEIIAMQTPMELRLGDWRPGRYAWALANIKPLKVPEFVRGKQGLWDWQWEGQA